MTQSKKTTSTLLIFAQPKLLQCFQHQLNMTCRKLRAPRH